MNSSVNGIKVLAEGIDSDKNFAAKPTLFSTSTETFGKVKELSEEIFGPTSIIVNADTKEDILSIARNLTGHLTATVYGTEQDLIANKDLIDILEQKVGRVVINGFPTGVEVCHAMVHGGPFPATTDGRSTSVGTAAIHRFTRPVCYQGLPDQLLPPELKNGNPLSIWRLVNGQNSRDPIDTNV